MYLGNERFVEKMQAKLIVEADLSEATLAKKRSIAKTLTITQTDIRTGIGLSLKLIHRELIV